MRARWLPSALFLAFICGAVTGCSSQLLTTPLVSSTASPAPSATPAPGSIGLSPSSLAFTAAGASSAQSFVASESGYAGAFTASTTTCAGIATISPAGGTAFTVTPVAAGSCSFVIAGANGQSATLSVGVTITNFGGS
jgi:hypothetical protein